MATYLFISATVTSHNETSSGHKVTPVEGSSVRCIAGIVLLIVTAIVYSVSVQKIEIQFPAPSRHLLD
jgi:hypothetical protein